MKNFLRKSHAVSAIVWNPSDPKCMEAIRIRSAACISGGTHEGQKFMIMTAQGKQDVAEPGDVIVFRDDERPIVMDAEDFDSKYTEMTLATDDDFDDSDDGDGDDQPPEDNEDGPADR